MKVVVLNLLCFFSVVCGSVLPYDAYQRISGGAVANIHKHPYATALLTDGESGSTYTQTCGGTILTTTSILSAASCFISQESVHTVHRWRARVGSNFANSGGFVHIIRSINPHPEYLTSNGNSDIAVLRVTIPLTYGDSIGFAKIAGAAYPAFETHQEISALGWGVVSEQYGTSVELREVQFWVVDQQTCRNRYAQIGFTVSDHMMCAGWLDVGVKAQCQGDAGSPILDKEAVVGVYSWTQGSCAEGWYPGLNTKVAPHTEWIIATANA